MPPDWPADQYVHNQPIRDEGLRSFPSGGYEGHFIAPHEVFYQPCNLAGVGVCDTREVAWGNARRELLRFLVWDRLEGRVDERLELIDRTALLHEEVSRVGLHG